MQEQQSSLLRGPENAWREQSKAMLAMNDQSKITSATDLWHFQITEFIPQVLNRVKAHDGSAEQANPFHTANTANTQAS